MKTRIAGLVGMAVLFFAPAVQADPVVITTGRWLEVGNIDGGGIQLVSEAFQVSGSWDCGANAAGWCNSTSFNGYAPGSTVDFTTTATTDGHHADVHGSVNGVSYGFDQTTGPLSFDGTQMLFAVAPFVIPASTPLGTARNFAVPFTMTGSLILTAFPSSGPSHVVFSNAVSGNGELHFLLRSDQYPSGLRYGVDGLSATFVFASNASPTPEPATLAMVGVALVFTARRLRRER